MPDSADSLAYFALIASSLCIGYWAGRSSKLSNIRAISAEPENAEDEYKLVLVVRSDLGMSAGKIAAQCSHATLACYKTMQNTNLKALREWERSGETKVALRCSDEKELLALQARAQSLNLYTRSIQDAGRTQIAAGSRTVLGIAGPARLINRITGKLRLL
ncbi:peptidyl-tRNA hydrolase PTH2-domain-containing protein [Amanita rubescens]|nr:peptidyl-tRNA hydrolase PTH2-domain-containing protein [Amanita rubescens]